MCGVATNVYSRNTSENPERCGLQTLSVKGSGVFLMHGEGISTPRVRHKGRQPLIKGANMTKIGFISYTLRIMILVLIFFYNC